MPTYTITEPHPTVPQNSYTHSGRGGAGNFFRAPATTSPAGVPTPATTTTTSSSSSTSNNRFFYSGRGGAGNARSAGERRPAASLFDEEYARAEARAASATGTHVGRGGAGNIFFSSRAEEEDDGEKLGRRDSSSTSASADSHRSTGFWARLSSSVTR